MKVSYFLYLFLLMVNLLLCFLIYKHKEKLHAYTNANLDMKSTIDYILDNRSIVDNIACLQYISEGEKVKNICLYSLENDTVLFSSKLNEKNKLIYYFSGNGCTACYDPILHKLDSVGECIGYDNILILAKFPSNKYLQTFCASKEYIHNLNIYRVDENLGLIPSTASHEYAYSFLLNENFIANKVIITDKANVSQSDFYFKYITEYLPY